MKQFTAGVLLGVAYTIVGFTIVDWQFWFLTFSIPFIWVFFLIK